MPRVWSWYQIVEARWRVRVLERRVARAPASRRTRALPALAAKKSYQVPSSRSRPGCLLAAGQVPRLGVAVALVADADRAVHVRDHRHRAGVAVRASRSNVGRVSRARQRRPAGWPSAASGRPAAGAAGSCPSRVHELVDPLDAHRAVPLWPRSSATARCGSAGPFARATSRRRSPTPWSPADRPAGSAARTAASRSRSSPPACPPVGEHTGSRHDRRNQQRGAELRHRHRAEIPTRDVGQARSVPPGR